MHGHRNIKLAVKFYEDSGLLRCDEVSFGVSSPVFRRPSHLHPKTVNDLRRMSDIANYYSLFSILLGHLLLDTVGSHKNFAFLVDGLSFWVLTLISLENRDMYNE